MLDRLLQRKAICFSLIIQAEKLTITEAHIQISRIFDALVVLNEPGYEIYSH